MQIHTTKYLNLIVFMTFMIMPLLLKSQTPPINPPKQMILLLLKNESLGLDSNNKIVDLNKQISESIAKIAQSNVEVMTNENILKKLTVGNQLKEINATNEIDTAKYLGAHLVMTGALFTFGSQKENYRLLVNLYDTQTAILLATKIISGSNLKEINQQLDKNISQLMIEGKTYQDLQSRVQTKNQIAILSNHLAGLRSDEIDFFKNKAILSVKLKVNTSYTLITNENINQFLPTGKTVEDLSLENEIDLAKSLGAEQLITLKWFKSNNEKSAFQLELTINDISNHHKPKSTKTIVGHDLNEIEDQMQSAIFELIQSL